MGGGVGRGKGEGDWRHGAEDDSDGEPWLPVPITRLKDHIAEVLKGEMSEADFEIPSEPGYLKKIVAAHLATRIFFEYILQLGFAARA